MEALRKAVQLSAVLTRKCLSVSSLESCSRNLSFLPRLLQPAHLSQPLLSSPPSVPVVTQICNFKVVGKPQRRCKDCFMVVRQERLYVICKTHPRHKQMSMKKKEKNTWILTHATQSPQRPW